MVWLVIFIVLMMFWLFFGGWYGYQYDPPRRPAAMGAMLLPWLCVLILGLVVFGAISAGTWR